MLFANSEKVLVKIIIAITTTEHFIVQNNFMKTTDHYPLTIAASQVGLQNYWRDLSGSTIGPFCQIRILFDVTNQ